MSVEVENDAGAAARDGERRVVKCVVWDLDHTLWDGILLEDDEVTLRPNVLEIVRELDERGILQSVASKNDPARAHETLRRFGLEEYFLYPQINWGSKAESVKTIAELINIGLDSVAFVDDQPFERAEVQFSLPSVLCLDAAELDTLLDLPELKPRFITEDSRRRRLMYLADQRRDSVEREFEGPKEEFLATLGMVFTIGRAREEDLRRAEELTVRTNQLNTTGRTYSYEELDAFRRSPRHRLLVTSLRDNFGGYGKIGLALIECDEREWIIRLLLMSCRVMSRGVGSILLQYVMRGASEAGVRLLAEFVQNDRNRMMFVTYKLAGFKELPGEEGGRLLECDLSRVRPFPDYVTVEAFD
jgi:FkbH-like protein